jgi:hypothetical protein
MIGAPFYRFQSYSDCKRFQASFAAQRREESVRDLTEESHKAAARELARLVETDASCKPVVWGGDAFGLLQWEEAFGLRVRCVIIGEPAADARLRAWFGEAL